MDPSDGAVGHEGGDRKEYKRWDLRGEGDEEATERRSVDGANGVPDKFIREE